MDKCRLRRAGRQFSGGLIPCFSHGIAENVLLQDDTQAIIKSTGCMAGKIAFDIGRKDIVYALHCGLDEDFTEGFNPRLGCEIQQTLMDGQPYCVHRIYWKD